MLERISYDDNIMDELNVAIFRSDNTDHHQAGKCYVNESVLIKNMKEQNLYIAKTKLVRSK